MEMQTAMPALPPCPRDFADWLPPIIVKELRQGLRTRLFVGVFVAVQAVTILLLGMRLKGGEGRWTNARELDALQWMAIGGALLVLLPLRGLAVISEETRMQTLDLMQLTHLSSLRMVVGKWLALVSQTLLLVTAILPYQVLYYFFGHVDVVGNLETLALMLGASLLLTAFCVALSPASLLVRIVILGVVGLPMYFMADSYIMSARYSGGMVFSRGASPMIWLVLFHGAMGTVFLLTVASARVAHLAENAAARMRIVALLTLLGSLAGACFAERDISPVWVLFGLPVLLWAGLESLTERASQMASTYLPFTRLGQPLIGRLFYPGWGTGMFFVLLITAGLVVAGVVVEAHMNPGVSSNGTMSLGMFHLGMAVLFPAAVLCVLPRVRQRHWLYVIVQLVCGAWFVEISSINFRSESVKAFFLGCNPLSEFFWTASHSYSYHAVDFDESRSANQMAAFTIELGMLCWLLVRSRQEFQTIRDGEAQARKLLPARRVSPPLPASP